MEAPKLTIDMADAANAIFYDRITKSFAGHASQSTRDRIAAARNPDDVMQILLGAPSGASDSTRKKLRKLAVARIEQLKREASKPGPLLVDVRGHELKATA